MHAFKISGRRSSYRTYRAIEEAKTYLHQSAQLELPRKERKTEGVE